MKKSIMIFDDEEDILQLCSIILGRSGYDVFTHTDCRDLIGKITIVSPSLILLDNKIPDRGGVIACQTIKSHTGTKDIPVVYFSAHDEVAALSRQAGADDFLQKPFDISMLEAIVRKYI